MKKTKKPKVPYRLIEPASEEGERLYQLLHTLVEDHHQDVLDARIALAWHTGWTPDADGRLTLGLCRKSADFEREIQQLAAFDFVILLNHNFWTDELVSDAERVALLDHELCHATVQLDLVTGEPVVNERGRTVYRIRKHDLEEFVAIAERYGCWKRDIEAFASSLARARQANLWIGFSGLRAELLGVGAPVPLETVCQWSEAERREAAVWAATVKTTPGSTVDVGCPAHVLSALQRPSA